MGNTYAQRKRTDRPADRGAASPREKAGLDALRAGLVQPTAAEKGRPVDLPDAMRAKMESAFGADLSAVRLYESQAVADAGAEAVTRGSEIAFAPGLADFSGYDGQALLGHELSHVVSQARGEVRGSGFLNDSALEARADREGARAAAGRQITAPAAPLSAASAAPAAGPMQAKKKGDDQLVQTYTNAGPAQASNLSQLNGQMAQPQFATQDQAEKPFGFWKHVNKANTATKATTGVTGSLANTGNFVASLAGGNALTSGVWGNGFKPASAGLLGAAGMLTGTATALSSGAAAYRGWRNIKAGGSRADPWFDAADSLAGLGAATSGTFAAVGNAAKIPKVPLAGAKHMMELIGPGQTLMPALSAATGLVTFGTGLYQGIRGGMRRGKIQDQIDALEQQDAAARQAQQQPQQPQPQQPVAAADDDDDGGAVVPALAPPQPLTDDQKKMLRTMRQGEKVQKRNMTGGILKSISGGLTAAGGAATLLGGAPVGFALGAIGAGVGAAGAIYNLAKTRSIRHDVLAEELGDMSYEQAVADVKAKVRKPKMSDSRAWKIFLKSKGYTDEKALYADVRKRRAAHMLDQAARGDQNAIDFVKAMGVKQVQGGGYAAGALDILAEKLG